MLVRIDFDSSDPADNAALSRLFGVVTSPVVSVTTAVAEEPVKAPAPAPKAAAKPKATPKAEPVVETPAEDDLLGGSDPAALREQAVQKATELVTSGQSAKVREALTGFGVKRVSDLADDQLEGFLEVVA